MDNLERRCLPGPLTVGEVFAIASDEVQACAREGDDPDEVRSNLMLVDHASRGAVCLDAETLADLDRRAAVSGHDRAEYLRWVLTGKAPTTNRGQ